MSACKQTESFSLHYAGDYQVSILFNDQPIPDSPFNVYVAPSGADATTLDVTDLDNQVLQVSAEQSPSFCRGMARLSWDLGGVTSLCWSIRFVHFLDTCRYYRGQIWGSFGEFSQDLSEVFRSSSLVRVLRFFVTLSSFNCIFPSCSEVWVAAVLN